MSSSDEEPLDPLYIDYQRRLDGLPPLQENVKGKERVLYRAKLSSSVVEWETSSEKDQTVQASISASPKGDGNEDTIFYSDPDDRMPSPPINIPDRPIRHQNTTYSAMPFRTPLRNLNTRGRVPSSSTRRGRHFGPSRPSIPRQLPYKRDVYIPPHRPTLQRQNLPHAEPRISRGRSPRRLPPIPDISNFIPPEPSDAPSRQSPRPRLITHTVRTWRPPEAIRLTDDSHFVPEREDSRWSDRRCGKSSGRLNRKSKGIAFFDTFKGTFAAHRTLHFEPQRHARRHHEPSSDEDNTAEEGNPREEGDREDVERGEINDNMLENEFYDGTPASPLPTPPPRQLHRARKLSAEISDDSEPDSVVDSDNLILANDSRGSSGIEDLEPERLPAPPPLESTPKPPDSILDALRPFILTSLPPRLPYLRRNLRQSFYHAFLLHMAHRGRLIPKAPSYASQQPSIHWEYHIAPKAEPWIVAQLGWTCQLCNFFPPFTLGSALMYHIQRDHSSCFARRKKIGFRRWKISVKLFTSALSAPPPVRIPDTPGNGMKTLPRVASRESIPGDTDGGAIEDPNRDEGSPIDDPIEELTSIMVNMETDVRRHRVGGIACYDLAMQETPMLLKGLAAKALEGRENDLCFYSKCSDKEKAMAIIWGRWICCHKIEFARNPSKTAMAFIDKHWEIIHRTAEQEGLIRWLLTMKFHRYFTQSQVAQLSKRYQRHLP